MPAYLDSNSGSILASLVAILFLSAFVGAVVLLVLVFSRRARNKSPRSSVPLVREAVGGEQGDHLKMLLAARLGATEAASTIDRIQSAGLWTPGSVYSISVAVGAMTDDDLAAWSVNPVPINAATG